MTSLNQNRFFGIDKSYSSPCVHSHLHLQESICTLQQPAFRCCSASLHKVAVELRNCSLWCQLGASGWDVCPATNVSYLPFPPTRYREEQNTQNASGTLCTMSAGNCEQALCVCVQIMKTPAALSYHGVGPMVSARVHDLDILWARTFQLFDLCSKVGCLHSLTSQ